jgi:hypothetical protein
MSSFGNTLISYQPLHITNNNTHPKWNKWKKIIVISSITIIIFLTIVSIKIYRNNKQKLINSTFITNLTSNAQLLSSITGIL